MKDLILIGSGGHAKVVIDIIEEEGLYKIHGVLTNDLIKSFCGYPVLGNDDYLDQLQLNQKYKIAIGIGGFKDNLLRKKIYNKFAQQNFDIVNCIHPTAVISSSVKLGKGLVIFAGVILNPEVVIHDNCIIATGSTIDHETIIKSHCLISAGVTIGANTCIEEESLCALGSKVISQVNVGKNVLVAAGAVVTNNILDGEIVFGIPAKTKK
jgi:sugar O-acyltransferase (sialic acid O-acetyltransferase NeuD family)